MPGFSLDPPRPGEMERYEKDGSLAARLEFARWLGNDRASPDLIRRKLAQIQALQEGRAFDREAFPYQTGLPSLGSPKIFALLIDFPDYPHTQQQSFISNKLFGNGDPTEFPYDSLRNFYQRSSYYQLTIQGNVLPWYRAQNNRDHYGSNPGVVELIKEALNYHNPTHDFSQYDNNGDGVIDYFCVVWTGPDNGWGNIWWAWCDMWAGYFYNNPFTVGGKHVGIFSWQWEKNEVQGQPHFMVSTVTHESGHALGLPDLYQYYGHTGPPGGVGGLDMMDSNWHDHNGFSKWLLDWLTPTAVGDYNVIHTLTLRPTSRYPDCVVVMPGQTLAKQFDEFFVVQNRARQDNDTSLPANGLLIWHVDARLNSGGNNFQYNNSDPPHKLVRLMEADGLESIQHGGAADAGDFYLPDTNFTPDPAPASTRYNGARSNVHVQNIGANTQARTVSFLLNQISLADGVDTTTLRWATGGDSVWFGEANPVAYHSNDARSGPIGNNQSTWLQPALPVQGTLEFDWKVSSEANYDYLEFYIGPTLMDRISGEVGFQTKSYLISSSDPNYVKWKYVKDGSGSAGSDRGWLDNVKFHPCVSLGEALDNTDLTWTTYGNAGWFGQTATSYYGGDSARSAPISNNQWAGLQTILPKAGTISFYWRVSSEQNYDYLEFYINNVLQDRISGAVYWQQKVYYVPVPGAILRWRYVKDGSISAGADCAWLDKVEYAPNPALAEATDNDYTSWTTTGNVPWNWESSVSYYGGDAARSSPVGNGQSSAIHLTAPMAGWLSFWWKASSELNHDYLELWIDGVFKERISGEVDWQLKIYGVQKGSKIDWKYVKDGSGFAGEDCGWIDRVLITDASLAQAVDCIFLAWSTGGSMPWFSESTTYTYGGKAAQSGHIGDNQESWIKTIVTGPGTMKYYWKVSSEAYADYLDFSIDGVLQDQIAGDVDWEQKTFAVGPGTHDLVWRYWKDIFLSEGTDAGWLDRVEWIPSISIGEAVDKPDLAWTTYGPANWFGEPTTYFYGFDAAQSGPIGNNLSTYLETTVNGGGTLRFYWKVSSELNHDYLEFYLDGVFKNRISGNVAWQQKVYVMPPGSHTLRWDYTKDGSGSAGADCGWVDKVEINANPSLGEALDNTALTWTSMGSAPWFGQTLTSYYGGDAAQSGNIAEHQFSTLQTVVTGPGLVTFHWKVSSDTFNNLQFWIDSNLRCSISNNVDWQERSYIVDAHNHTLNWRYVKTTPFVDGQDCGWVDKVVWTPGAVTPPTLNVPQDAPTIQSAINAAQDRSVIIVAPGVYHENINFKDKGITVRSTNPANPSVVAATIIDGGQAGSVVTFGGWEGTGCMLRGLTIRNGRGHFGGGIYGNGTSATIQNCVITSNSAVSGGAVYGFNGLIQENIISQNRGDFAGGGLVFCNGPIRNNLIYGNSAIYGGGLAACYGAILNNTIFGDSATSSGGGLYACTGVIRNCIIWGNTAPSQPQLYGGAMPSYCCIQGWTGGGTKNLITASPRMVNPVARNFHLQSASPCIDAGCAIAGLTRDFEGTPRPLDGTAAPRGDGSNYDIGAYEYVPGPTASRNWWLYR
jgi:M6 family metalloprotease-like protein